MGNKTPLYAAHQAMGAKLVDFAGWDMPINYGSQIEEHHAVRQGAGMFDVSHMTVVDLTGAHVRDYLRRLLANDVVRLKAPGKALYSCMLNEKGGVVDDLITYYFAEDWFRLVVNAATREKDLAWLERHIGGHDVDVTEDAGLALEDESAEDRPRIQVALEDPRDRITDFREIERGLTEAQALYEAGRCLRCDLEKDRSEP